ncbi:MAG: Slp/YeaY family lipoprotein [Thermodesulfobacteriota bacterium]|nr:Slp/YeaY family lipoprotein [Thermodesulfobacteriota bacterium]
MKRRFSWFLLLSLILFLSGCAHVISKDLRIKSDLSLTLSQVRQNPDAFEGKRVVWGGEIIETVNQKDGTTQIEVFQRPLGWRGEPRETYPSEGRFLVLTEKYLDPYLFQRGRKITVAGEIQGEKIKPLGEMDFKYPLLLSKKLYLWPEYYYAYPPPYYYYYYDPGWPYPYGWGYPYGGRFYFYYRYHRR